MVKFIDIIMEIVFVIDYVCLKGMFGNDAYAQTLRRVLEENHVVVEHSQYCDRPSGQAYILLHADGDNSIILIGGSNMVIVFTIFATFCMND